MSALLENLSLSQRQALDKGDLPTLVLAGPGSGKTRTLVAKVASILAATTGQYDRILALTFTNKAAAEMLARISNDGLDGDGRCQATTFHSFACELLRQHGHLIGLAPDFSLILGRADREAFLHSLEPSLLPFARQLHDATESVGKIGGDLATLVREGSLNAFFASLVERYCIATTKDNRVDMNLVLYLANKLLSAQHSVRELVRLQFPYVCVDEFQDSNEAQMSFLQLIADDRGSRLFIVADDDQVLYAWNGASSERLLAVKQIYAPESVQLAENYRCVPEILALANTLITSNKQRDETKQPLIATKPAPADHPVRCVAFADEHGEVEWLCADIAERVRLGETRIAVLGRTRASIEPVCDSLTKRGIAACIVSRSEEFASLQMQWMHSIVKFVLRPNDAIVAHRVCALSSKLSGVSVEIPAGERQTLLQRWQTEMELFVTIAKDIDEVLSKPLREFIEDSSVFLQWCDAMTSCFVLRAASLPQTEREALEYDLLAWKEICGDLQLQFGDRLDLATFVQELDMRSKSVSPPSDAIQCFTVHGSKGLEFKHVYIVGMYDGGIPFYKAVKKGANSAEMEEERRGCFVAITRAETTLTMSYALSNRGYNSEPSRFLNEMGLTGVIPQ